MSANKDVASRQRQVLGQLMFHREVALISVGILKVLLHRQSEREHWTKPGERLVVESLSAKLILGAGGNSWSYDSGRTNRSHRATRSTNSSLEYLGRIQQSCLCRTA